jgi:hypothetical protein
MLLHNCLPHNHFDTLDHFAQHDTVHHDDEDDDQGFLSHAFAHFQHDKGAQMSIMSGEKNEVGTNPDTAKELISFITIFLLKGGVEPPPVYLPPRHAVSLYSFPASTTYSRRGPPAFPA